MRYAPLKTVIKNKIFRLRKIELEFKNDLGESMSNQEDNDPLEKYGVKARHALKHIQELFLSTYTEQLAKYTEEDLKLDPACASEAKYDAADIVSDILSKEIKEQSVLMNIISGNSKDLDSSLKDCLETVVEKMIDSYLVEKASLNSAKK